jgi:predicted Rdx family selenoprotein
MSLFSETLLERTQQGTFNQIDPVEGRWIVWKKREQGGFSAIDNAKHANEDKSAVDRERCWGKHDRCTLID